MNAQLTRAERLARRLARTDGRPFVLDGVSVVEVAARAGTPFYVYSGTALVEQVKVVQQALGACSKLYYSIKANPSLGLCSLLAARGLQAEVASGGELMLAVRAGFAPDQILFAGPGKTDEELELAVQTGIRGLNVESLGEIRRSESVAARCGRRAKIGLRINPRGANRGAQMRMGGGAQQFGIDQEQVPDALSLAASCRHVDVVGLHVYSGTQVFDAGELIHQCNELVDIAIEVAESSGVNLEFVDFGGGFGVRYFDELPEFDLAAFAEAFLGVAGRLRAHPQLKDTEAIIELGRYLVADAGIYVMRVVDVKNSRGKTIAVTDGGMHHHLAATGNFGQVFRRPYPIVTLDGLAADDAVPIMIAGPCCTPLDVFGTEVPLAAVHEGDLLGVMRSGAYGLTASSLRFLSHPSPAEVLVFEGRICILREAGRMTQVFEGQRQLDPLFLEAASSR